MALSPPQALYGSEKALPPLPPCVHYAGSEKFIRKALALQAVRGPVFDIACDCEDGAPIGSERAHAALMAGLIGGEDNRFSRVGARVKLKYSRAILDAIHSGALVDAPTVTDPIFGFEVVAECPNVPSEILIPRNTWADKDAYDQTARKLAHLFSENFKTYENGVSSEVKAAAPAM